jgi:hypothetical protein
MPRMSTRHILVRLASLIVCTSAPIIAQSRCRTSPDSSAHFASVVQSWLTDSSSVFMDPLRKRLGLNRTAPSSVVVILDPTTCAKASRAWDLSPVVVDDPLRAVYLVRAGTNRYFVWHPEPGARNGVIVLDQKFKYLAALMLL